MDRTEASIAPARGGDRTPDSCARSSRRPWSTRLPALARRLLGAALFVLIFLAGPVPGSAAGQGASAAPATTAADPSTAPAAPATAAAGGRRADHISLVRQSPWVGPELPDQDLTLALDIQSVSPRPDLALSFTVYSPLTTLSAFDETLSGRALGTPVAQSPAIALPAFSTDAQGVTHVTIPVDGDTTPTGTGNWTADLKCRPGSCANVYPVKVTLTDSSASGSASASTDLVTYLDYDDPSSSSQALRFALVVPEGLAPPVAGADGRVPPPDPHAVATLDGLLDAIGSAAVPVTLEPDPATLTHLAATGHGHTVAEAASVSDSPARQTLTSSYVPVDAGALVGAGLRGELEAQLKRGAQVLAGAGGGVHASDGVWVATSGLGQLGVDALASHFEHLVVPPGVVSGGSGPLTTTQPFTLAPQTAGHVAAPVAMVSDTGLGARLAAAGKGADGPLTASQMLAELSLIYYEAPNLLGPGGAPAARGVIGVAPAAWAPDTAFVSALLGGLQGNPVIQPVTVDQLFAQVPVGADRQPVTRHPTAPASPPSSVVRALRAARTRQMALQSATGASAAGSASAQSVGDLLLAAESSLLTPRQQQAALSGFDSVSSRQLRGLSVRSDTVRLTAGTASVPITIVRNTPYPVTVLVRLTSDKVRFPKADAQSPGALCQAPRVQSTPDRSSFSARCALTHSTNAVYIDMQSRASGDFRIGVQLTSPEGGFVLAGGQLTVRSLATSAVAIVLSVGAVLVLLVWWGRTLWRGKARRGAHTVTRARASTT